MRKKKKNLNMIIDTKLQDMGNPLKFLIVKYVGAKEGKSFYEKVEKFRY